MLRIMFFTACMLVLASCGSDSNDSSGNESFNWGAGKWNESKWQ